MFVKLGTDLLINRLAASVLLNSPMRVRLMRRLGMRIDLSANLESGCWFSSFKTSIGPGCRLNVQCFFDSTESITIGANCNFGPQVMIHTSAHTIGDAERRCGRQIPLPVTVGAGTWLGLRSVVLPGVTVGEGCVIAAGAVVASDCAPHGLYAGVPARRIRELEPVVAQVDRALGELSTPSPGAASAPRPAGPAPVAPEPTAAD